MTWLRCEKSSIYTKEIGGVIAARFVKNVAPVAQEIRHMIYHDSLIFLYPTNKPSI